MINLCSYYVTLLEKTSIYTIYYSKIKVERLFYQQTVNNMHSQSVHNKNYRETGVKGERFIFPVTKRLRLVNIPVFSC